MSFTVFSLIVANNCVLQARMITQFVCLTRAANRLFSGLITALRWKVSSCFRVVEFLHQQVFDFESS